MYISIEVNYEGKPVLGRLSHPCSIHMLDTFSSHQQNLLCGSCGIGSTLQKIHHASFANFRVPIQNTAISHPPWLWCILPSCSSNLSRRGSSTYISPLEDVSFRLGQALHGKKNSGLIAGPCLSCPFRGGTVDGWSMGHEDHEMFIGFAWENQDTHVLFLVDRGVLKIVAWNQVCEKWEWECHQ